MPGQYTERLTGTDVNGNCSVYWRGVYGTEMEEIK